MATMKSHNVSYLGRPTMVSLILTNLYRRGPMLVEELKRVVKKVHPDSSKNSIHTALNQLTKRGEIIKQGKAYRLLTFAGAQAAQKILTEEHRLDTKPEPLAVRPPDPLPSTKAPSAPAKLVKADPKPKAAEATKEMEAAPTNKPSVVTVPIPSTKVTQVTAKTSNPKVTPDGEVTVTLTLTFKAEVSK